MKPPGGKERRRGRRYTLASEFKGRELSLLGAARRHKKILRGEVQNIGNGGLCLLTSQVAKELHFVRGKIVLPGIPAGIPSLMQVRWVRRAAGTPQYCVGLQFLF